MTFGNACVMQGTANFQGSTRVQHPFGQSRDCVGSISHKDQDLPSRTETDQFRNCSGWGGMEGGGGTPRAVARDLDSCRAVVPSRFNCSELLFAHQIQTTPVFDQVEIRIASHLFPGPPTHGKHVCAQTSHRKDSLPQRSHNKTRIFFIQKCMLPVRCDLKLDRICVSTCQDEQKSESRTYLGYNVLSVEVLLQVSLQFQHSLHDLLHFATATRCFSPTSRRHRHE